MATVWQPDSLWTQQNGVCTGISPGAPAPAHLTSGSELLSTNQASRCSSVRSPPLPLPRRCGGGDGFSSAGRRQEQEHLWQQFFLDPTMWWDNRRDKKSSRAPDFRRKRSGEVLWLNNVFKPAWVDEQLVSLDMQMGHGAPPSKSSFSDNPEPGRHAGSGMSSMCSSVGSPALPLPRMRVGGDELSSDGRRQEQEHLWQQCFPDPTMRWDNRREKKSSRPPEFRRKGSGEVLWLNNVFKPACVDKQLVSLDVQMGHGAFPSKSSSQDKPEPGRREYPGMSVVTAGTVSMLCQQGKLSEAVEALESLAQTYFGISQSLFYTVLKLCAAKKDLVVGRRVHDLAVKLGYDSNAYLGNHILRMYASGGRLEEAMDVLTRVDKPNVFMWFSIISAYAKHGKPKEAIQLYRDMRRTGVEANAHVFVAALQACAFAADLESGKNLHCDVLHSGIPTDSYVGNCLVDMYAKCGELKDARQVFDSMATKDVVTWNALISGYAKCGELKDARQVFDSMITKNVVTWNALITGYAEQGLGHEALVLYEQMEQEGLILANHVTFACLLKACVSTGALQKGRQLHSQIVERGLLDDILVGTCLVDMYAKCGELEDAHRVFESLATKNVVTWTALIAGYAQQGPGQEALILYGQMEQEGLILANHVTLGSLLMACGSTGALQKGRELHSQIVERGLLDNVVLGTGLVDMYAKCGELEDARQVFDSMNTKNVVTWNALISGYGTCDDGQSALACFEEMLVAGVQPDGATFSCLLVACSHEGLVDEGRKHFDSMAEQHGIKPTTEHYNCMIDLLGRAGHLDEAENMLLSCKDQCNIVGLRSLLNACKSHGDIERATWCFEKIVRLDPQRASAYVLMANAYADAGRWTDVNRIETQRMAAGANKKPAVASIEVKKEVHKFVVGEKRDNIALKVENTNARLKQEGGHVPLTKLVLKPLSEKEKENVLCGHAEKLALAFGLLNTPSGTPLVVTKNLRMCSDCHSSTEIMSRLEQRDIVVRDGYRVHRFVNGSCSCNGRP